MNPYTFKNQREFRANDAVFLGGSICAWCTVLWIGDAYETRPWPNAPAHRVEYVRQSVLRNTQTGLVMIYPFRDSTADGRLRVQEASA